MYNKTNVLSSVTELYISECGAIRHGGGMCIHPKGGRADASRGTPIVTASGCSGARLRFCYTRTHSGATEGDIVHESGNCLVPGTLTDSPWNDVSVVLGPCGVSYSRWRFTQNGNIQHVSSGMCWHPKSGRVSSDNGVIVYNSCQREQRLTFRIAPQ